MIGPSGRRMHLDGNQMGGIDARELDAAWIAASS
jgi:hypothetical protein